MAQSTTQAEAQAEAEYAAGITRAFTTVQQAAHSLAAKSAGYEDAQRFKEKQKRLKEQAAVIAHGGKVKKPDQNSREHPEKPLVVHLVPHSHTDLGWVKTVDEYYSGSNMGQQHASVHNILDTVVEELPKNPSRRFTYAEMGFFTMWYNRQDAETKERVKQLIQNKQLEIVNGGWSANDEASPNFEDIINNMMLGHEFLNHEFGVQPRIGWDVDTFGHSSANTRLFAEMGFEAMFFSRMDHGEKDARSKEENKAMNFLWRPDATHFGKQYQILTNVFRTDYCFPAGFATGENYESDDPFITDETLSTFNAKDKMVDFVNWVNDLTRTRLGQNIMVPMGCDFTFQNARQEFQNLERAIEYINKHNTANLTLIMSTPSFYIDSLKEENITWPVKYDDAFPYSNTDTDFWVGYFSSRPGAKKQVKDASGLFGAEMKLLSQRMIREGAKDSDVKAALDAKQAMLEQLSVYQHHDAITGTAKQYVADDYTYRLQKAVDFSSPVYHKELADILRSATGIEAFNLSACAGSNNDTVVQCPISDKENAQKSEFIVIVHNQANKPFQRLVTVKVPHKNFRASTWSKRTLGFEKAHADVLEQSHFTNKFVKFVDYELYIPHKLEANEVSFIKVQEILIEDEADKEQNSTATVAQQGSQQTSLEIKGFSPEGEVLFDYENVAQQVSQTFGVNLNYYKPHVEQPVKDEAGEDVDEKKLTPHQKLMKSGSEGAYVFKPEFEEGEYSYLYQYSELDTNVVYQKGRHLEQWTIFFENKTSHEQAIIKVRFSPQFFEEIIEFEVELNPVQIDDEGRGKDVIVHWKLYDGFDAKGRFWTDSNALGMVERNVNLRPSFNFTDKTSNISANYYPVDSAIVVRDQNGSNLQVTIMNDRAQGGAADVSGQATIELMQQRRTTYDDGKGVNEPLNETDAEDHGLRVTAKYYMQIFDFSKFKSKQREQ